MRKILSTSLLVLLAFVSLLDAASVGSGAPNTTAQAGFVNAYLRGSFQTLTLPPTTDVIALGPTGLIQQFPAQANRSLTFALVKPDANAPVSATDTLQVFPDLFAVYSNIGVGNAGYPVMDTTACPANSYGVCNFQLFTKNYGMFAFSTPQGVTYMVRDPFYSEWVAQGGIAGTLGLPIDSERSVTSNSKLGGTQQLFLNGAVYTYNNATTTGTVTNTFSIRGTTYGAYTSGGGFLSLGFPTSAEIALASGLHRQTFEFARIEWSATAAAQILYPVVEIDIQGAAQGLTLQVGDAITLTAATYDSNGFQVTGRALSWSTTNGQAISIQPNGYAASIRAIGKGTANVSVTGEGKASAPIQIRVGSTCCDVGDGAPTAAIQQAFQSAVTRNQLVLSLPNATPVVRSAGGYIQEFVLNAVGGGSLVISESDKSLTAFIVTPAVEVALVKNGGFAGALGFPSSDISSGGTQLFEGGWALAGSPVRAVLPAIRSKWASLSYEAGPLGVPIGDSASYTTVANTAGFVQSFVGGNIYALSAAAAFASTGPILNRYVALLGPGGALGAPTSDITNATGVARQNFENGYIDLQPGAAVAVEHLNPRKPSISVTPSRVVPGGRVHIAVAGFALSANLTVTQTNQAAFQVAVPQGLYSWDVVVPGSAVSGTISIQAKDGGGGDAATGSYAVTGVPQLVPSLTVVSGDGQTGASGSLLPLPLVAVLKDLDGNPIAGVPVFASASPGATVQASAATDAKGLISANVRMPLGGVAIISITAGGRVVSFSARSAAYTIPGFTALSQQDNSTMVGSGSRTLGEKGSMVTALAELIRFQQNQGRVGIPNGLATPQSLNQYLSANQGYAISETGDQIVNPWSAAAFAGLRGGIAAEAGDVNRIADLVSAGSPVAIGFVLQIDGVPGSTTFAVATGISEDGALQIADSAYGRTALTDYTGGFTAAGHNITGAVASLMQVVPNVATPLGFVVSAPTRAAETIVGPSGSCAAVLNVSDIQIPGLGASSAVGGVRFVACDGTQAAYQASFSEALPVQALDLLNATTQSIATAKTSVFLLTRGFSGLVFRPQVLSASAIVNSASFTSQIAPGGLATIYGYGFTSGVSEKPAVTVGGQPATVNATFPFQLNIQVPDAVVPGPVTVRLSGTLGTASQDVSISATAPAVFSIGVSTSGQALGAAVNQDGTVNGPATPASRGEYVAVFCTGLGAKATQNSFQVAKAAVKVLVGGIEVTPVYAGIAPGLLGVDQVNFQIPANMPPSLNTILAIRQAGVDSPAVVLAIQ